MGPIAQASNAAVEGTGAAFVASQVMPEGMSPGRWRHGVPAFVLPRVGSAAVSWPVTALLEAQGLAKRYGRRVVLDGASFSVNAGEMVGVSGGNGAGKSTLLKILAGLLSADAGAIKVSAPIGYAPQAILLYGQLTVEEHFEYFSAARRITTPWAEAGRELARRYRFEAWWREPVENLSEGTKQKLNLALALAPAPELLLLDEPYAGFDWETYLLFWEHAAELRRAGKSLLIVSHLFHDRTKFDRVLRLADGRIEPEGTA
jgi:ABC-type multidrug transport system ATPase subunit